MNKFKKIFAIILCVIFVCSCAPQMRRIVPPQGIKKPHVPLRRPGVGENVFDGKISASYERIDISFGKVTASNAAIKSGPGDNFDTLGTVTTGDQLNVYGKVNGWYLVKLPNSSSIGCIKENQLKPHISNLGLKKIPSVPPPTNNGAPNIPGSQGTPNVPGEQGTPNVPDEQGTPNAPGEQGTPGMPGAPAQPDMTFPGPSNTTGREPNAGKNEDTAGTGVMTTEEKRILELCNSERSKTGAPALIANNDLTKLARMKSKDIVDNNYFSHQSPTYGSPFDMMKDHGINYMYAGENLAQNSSAEKAFNAWMNSEGHRKNILNANFTELGVGIAPKGDGSFIYTQMFIGK